MLDSLVSGFTEIGKRPSIILPAVVMAVANLIIALLAFEPQADFFYSVFVLGEIVDATIIELPFYMLVSYPWEIIVMIAAAFIALALWIFMIYTYAESSGKGIGQAFGKAFSRAGEILGIAGFVFVAAFLYFAVLFAFVASTLVLGALSILGLLAAILWMLFGIYAGVKLIFTPAIMAVKSKKLKKALAESWKLKNKGFWQAAIFIGLASIIAGAIWAFFSGIGEASGNEAVFFIAVLLGVSISNAYYSIVFIKYIAEQKFSFSH